MNRIDRRGFLRTLGLGAASLAGLWGCQPSDKSETSPPNILFCIADDWGWPHAGVYGDRAVQTPAFDRLASEGIAFEHAFVMSPSCTPRCLTSILIGPGIN